MKLNNQYIFFSKTLYPWENSIKNLRIYIFLSFLTLYICYHYISASICSVSLSICMVKAYSAPSRDEKELSSIYFQKLCSAVLVDRKDPSPFVRGVKSKQSFLAVLMRPSSAGTGQSPHSGWFQELEGGSCKTLTFFLFRVIQGKWQIENVHNTYILSCQYKLQSYVTHLGICQIKNTILLWPHSAYFTCI